MTHSFVGRIAAALLAAAFLALPGELAAQSAATTGVIRGTVSDGAGAPLVGATATLRNTATNVTRTVQSNVAGVFVAPLLPLGSYEVRVRAVGHRPVEQKGISVTVGSTVALSFKLERAATELQAVTISATQDAQVDPSRTTVAASLGASAIKALPNNGRNFLALTTLTPNVAVAQGPDGDVLSIAGQRGIHNNVSVDGADFNNPFFGEQRGGQRPAFTFNLDAVQEMVVTAQGANAEFGRSSGGFVNVITKSGTNTRSGSLHYFGKSSALSGDLKGNGVTLKPDFAQHQFGFTLGGPIKQDKAWYFVAYDQQAFSETKQTDRGSSPAFSKLKAWTDTAYGGALRGDFGPTDRTNDAQVLMLKLDYKVSDRTNASLKYNFT
ncbi:MAG: TonB-dependent receptor, partial [Gemmatimonadota bacterium]